ncbi:restriction endonuclease [Tsukamurella ocularis]
MEYITTPAQAEQNAARRMREELGFPDARVTQATNDGGIDVQASRAVAQVKWESNQSGRPVLQNLFGARGNALHKKLLFFNSGGYSRAAIEYADAVDMALFKFDPLGELEPMNRVAERLIKDVREEKERKAREAREREREARERERSEQLRAARERRAREALALVERERQARARRALELAERERRSREAREAENVEVDAATNDCAVPQIEPSALLSVEQPTTTVDSLAFTVDIGDHVPKPASPSRGVKHYAKWTLAWAIFAALPLYAAFATSGWAHAAWIIATLVGVLGVLAQWTGDEARHTESSFGIFGTALAVAVGYWAFNVDGVFAGVLWVVTALIALLSLLVVFDGRSKANSM